MDLLLARLLGKAHSIHNSASGGATGRASGWPDGGGWLTGRLLDGFFGNGAGAAPSGASSTTRRMGDWFKMLLALIEGRELRREDIIDRREDCWTQAALLI